MNKGSYKKLSLEEKVKAVNMVMSGMGLRQVCKETGLSKTTIRQWVANEDINPDKEYARAYMGNRPWLIKKVAKKGSKDPFPEGVVVASKTNPDEMARENRDLRKKISYLEGKVAYLETLYALINTAPDKISKKKDLKPSADSSQKEETT